jgi:hypothetical protein
MRFDLHTHETLILLMGVLGLIEQEAARLFFDLNPSSILSGIFGSMVLGSIGAGAARDALSRRQNGEKSE